MTAITAISLLAAVVLALRADYLATVARNLAAYNADLRQQVLDLTRERDRYRRSNSYLISESVGLVAEAEYLHAVNAHLQRRWNARRDEVAAVVLTRGLARPERKMTIMRVPEWEQLP